MRFLPSKIHGILDYLVGLLLVLFPLIFNFDNGGVAMWFPIVQGFLVIVYSVFTDYELGAIKLIGLKTHLLFDLLGGILLSMSPWLFNFSEDIFLPHLAFGIFEVLASLITRQMTGTNPGKRGSAFVGWQ